MYKIKTEAKLLKALDRVLNQANEPISEAEALATDKLAVMDPANVAMVLAKSDRAKKVLAKFKEKDDTPKVPDINYEVEIGEKLQPRPQGGKYSVEYVEKLTKIFSANDDESVIIKTAEDFPLTMESEDWIVFLAPRIVD